MTRWDHTFSVLEASPHNLRAAGEQAALNSKEDLNSSLVLLCKFRENCFFCKQSSNEQDHGLASISLLDSQAYVMLITDLEDLAAPGC